MSGGDLFLGYLFFVRQLFLGVCNNGWGLAMWDESEMTKFCWKFGGV